MSVSIDDILTAGKVAGKMGVNGPQMSMHMTSASVNMDPSSSSKLSMEILLIGEPGFNLVTLRKAIELLPQIMEYVGSLPKDPEPAPTARQFPISPLDVPIEITTSDGIKTTLNGRVMWPNL